MKLIIEMEGELSAIADKLAITAITPEELIQVLFDCHNTEAPNIISKQPLSYCRAGSGLTVTVKCDTAKDI